MFCSSVNFLLPNFSICFQVFSTSAVLDTSISARAKSNASSSIETNCPLCEAAVCSAKSLAFFLSISPSAIACSNIPIVVSNLFRMSVSSVTASGVYNTLITPFWSFTNSLNVSSSICLIVHNELISIPFPAFII